MFLRGSVFYMFFSLVNLRMCNFCCTFAAVKSMNLCTTLN